MSFGGSWNEERDEREERIAPLSHWDEDLDLGILSSHFNGKPLPIEQPESNYEYLLRRLDETIEDRRK